MTVADTCREAILDALSPLSDGKDSGVAGGEGAIYFWAKLPQGAESPFNALGLWVMFLRRNGGISSVWRRNPLLRKFYLLAALPLRSRM